MNRKRNENEVDKKMIAEKIIALLIIGVVLAFAYNAYKLIRKPAVTATVKNGSLTLEESLTGYIIREETVVQGENYKNGIIPIKAEGEKVAKGASVYRYADKQEAETDKKIQELDEQINDAISNQENLFPADMKLLETQIEEKLAVLYLENDLEKLREYKKEISDIVSKKAQIAGDASPSGSYIKQLVNERASYLAKKSSSSEEVYATTSGIMSYKVDGLEEKLLPGDFSYLSSEFLDSLDLKTGQIISSSNEKGKVINNFSCYIATNMNSEKAKAAKEGDKVTIRLSSSDEVSAKIVYISDDKNNSKLIVFEISTGVEKLTNYRKVSVDVIWWQDSGLRVPNVAITQEGDISYVTRLKGGYQDKIPVKILRVNEDYSIVDNYTKKELEDLGIENAGSMRKITMYDEVIVK